MLEKSIVGGTVRHVSDLVSLEWETAAVGETGDTDSWNAWWHQSKPVTVPPHTIRRVIVDLENYYCAYPELVGSGGAGSEIYLNWAEALYTEADPKFYEAKKGQRDQSEGMCDWGLGNRFTLEGGAQRVYCPLWWRCGRYIQLVIKTGDKPITLERLFGWANAPFAWLIGVPASDCVAVGQVLGERLVTNEFLGYVSLTSLSREGLLQDRSFTLATYALCGFANFTSIAIQIGGIGALVPERRADLARFGFIAMLGGVLACYLTACLVGFLL